MTDTLSSTMVPGRCDSTERPDPPSHMTNEEISEALFLSVNTVKTHLRSAYKKLGVRSRRDAIARGRRLGLLLPGPDGASNRHIARALGPSLKTVQNHVSRILDKLQAADPTQAVLRARGLAAPPP